MKGSSFTRIVIGGFFLSVIAFVVARYVVFDLVRVDDDAMFPAVRPDGIVWVLRNPYGSVSEVRRGDVIGFENQGAKEVTLRRVVGLPGEVVKLDGRTITINGRPLKLDSVGWDGSNEVFAEGEEGAQKSWAISFDKTGQMKTVTTTVPADQLFVLSDFRIRRGDSREFGPVDFSRVRNRSFQ